jgi:hypothetical protein
MSNNMLREWSSFSDSNVTIDQDSNKNCFMKGIFVQADKRNLNERVYPLQEIARAVQGMQSRIQATGGILGECDHPDTLTVNIDNVSHIITEIHMEGANGVGALKLLPTPKGQIIRTMLEAGVKLGVSSRGSGNVDYNGTVSDFDIVTVDIVAQPSAPDAYPKPIFESLYRTGGYKLIESIAVDVLKGSAGANTELSNEILGFFRHLRNNQ